MEYKLKCRFCGKITECKLGSFDGMKGQRYEIICEHCGKTNIKMFPDDLKFEQFYKDFNERERLLFQKYFFERKSLGKISKETTIPITTIWVILTKKFKLRSIREARRIYWREDR